MSFPELTWSGIVPRPNDEGAEVLGVGAFAWVYRAWHCRTDDAVKVLNVSVTAERFATELRAMASVFHPNAVRLLGTVVREEPRAVVMELCTRGTLRDVLDAVGASGDDGGVREGKTSGRGISPGGDATRARGAGAQALGRRCRGSAHV